MTQGILHSQDYQIRLKSGLEDDINSTATKNSAIFGEPHWAVTGSSTLFIFDGIYNEPVSSRMYVENATGTIPLLCSYQHLLLCNPGSGTFHIGLPDCGDIGKNKSYWFKKVDSSANEVLIIPSGTATIEGSPSGTLSSQYESLWLITDGNNWFELP